MAKHRNFGDNMPKTRKQEETKKKPDKLEETREYSNYVISNN